MKRSKLRKFLTLAPLLVIAAFAVMPAAAQAEPHFYSNHVGLPAESGGPGAEGKDTLAWGKLELEAKSIGKLICENEFGGDAYNPGGPEGAQPGEAKVDAYAVYDCTNEGCEVALKSKIEIIPEGLDKFGEWEAKLTEPEVGVIRLKTGNKTLNSPTQIKFLISCPPNGLGEIKTPSRGELTPKLKNGTLIGSAPSKIEFGLGSGELELAGIPEGKVNGSLKVMGYETGEIISTSNP
jgi:hypothetical protein